jgi:hypothetical protein
MSYNTIETLVSKKEKNIKEGMTDAKQSNNVISLSGENHKIYENHENHKHSENYENYENCENYENLINNTIWYENPRILFSINSITELYPKENTSQEQKINAITRLIIILTFVGFVFLNNTNILISGIISIIILIFLYNIMKKRSASANNINRELFSNNAAYEQVKHNFTNPTIVNPTMNILLPEIQDNPNRLDAAPSYKKPVVDKINEETKNFILSNFNNSEGIRNKLFNSGTNQFDSNNFDFEQSMRQFYTTANTKIPNNQKEFAKFCYGNMASCRDGDVEMCSRNLPRHVML